MSRNIVNGIPVTISVCPHYHNGYHKSATEANPVGVVCLHHRGSRDPADGTQNPNSKSGNAGVAYAMSRDYGFETPKSMHPEMGALVRGHNRAHR
jgi:hypothetical protein